MDDPTQNNNDLSSGFLIKDKQGNIKKVKDDIIGDYEVDSRNIPNQPVSNRIPFNTDISENKTSNIIPTQPSITQPFQPSPAVKSPASFTGDPDEEEEIRKHQEELNKILDEATVPSPVAMQSDVVKQVIEKFNLTFTNDILAKRFQKVLESRMKQIRNPIETAEVLHRSSKVGGLELPEEKASEIVKYIDTHSSRAMSDIPTQEKPASENIPSVSAQANQINYAQAPPAFIPIPKKKEPTIPVAEKNEAKISAASGLKVDQSIKLKEEFAQGNKDTAEQKINDTIPIKPVEDLYKRSAVDEMSKMASIRRQIQQRPQVVDIRQPISVTGPVEELMKIDLKEFRRLGNNPGESTEKILEKIYLLEEESWNMRMDGIAAWQKSPLNQKYLSIGRDSLKNNKPVVEVINSNADAENLSLHFQEFLAVNDLNNKMVV